MEFPIPIPYANQYTVTLEGTVYKYVHCEKCAYEFAYGMAREGEGAATSMFFVDNAGAQSRATQEALRNLHKRLTETCDPVPCPGCGWYQEHMHPFIRAAYGMWMNYTAGILFAASLILFIWFLACLADPQIRHYARVSGPLCLAMVVVSAGFVMARWLLARSIRPNIGDLEARKLLGEKLALPWHEFERLSKLGELVGPPPTAKKTPFLADLLERTNRTRPQP